MFAKFLKPVLIALAWVLLFPAALAEESEAPQRVTIRGYFTDAMEPFITKDGRYLLFNNSNDPRIDTNLQIAVRVDDLTFEYSGAVKGAASTLLDGVPSMDREGNLYFVSTRDYQQTLATIFRGRFDKGTLSDAVMVPGLSLQKLGQLNFDAEISADGQTLFAVDGKFSGKPYPDTADIFVAVRDGSGFHRQADSAAILKNINSPALEYAPAISADQLDLYFTRASRRVRKPPVIMHASRTRISEPFGVPLPVASITGFVEAPSLSADGCSLYFHKRDGDRFRIYRVSSNTKCVPGQPAQ